MWNASKDTAGLWCIEVLITACSLISFISTVIMFYWVVLRKNKILITLCSFQACYDISHLIGVIYYAKHKRFPYILIGMPKELCNDPLIFLQIFTTYFGGFGVNVTLFFMAHYLRKVVIYSERRYETFEPISWTEIFFTIIISLIISWLDASSACFKNIYKIYEIIYYIIRSMSGIYGLYVGYRIRITFQELKTVPDDPTYQRLWKTILPYCYYPVIQSSLMILAVIVISLPSEYHNELFTGIYTILTGCTGLISLIIYQYSRYPTTVNQQSQQITFNNVSQYTSENDDYRHNDAEDQNHYYHPNEEGVSLTTSVYQITKNDDDTRLVATNK
jgi:hypothetical protein